jgi:protein gp37
MLDWLLLTKRPENFYTNYPAAYEEGMPWAKNVWLGVTAENQKRADERIPLLLKTPAVVHFVSVEPMLEPVDLRRYLGPQSLSMNTTSYRIHHGLNWIICGCEKVGNRPGRPMEDAWARDLWRQALAHNIPFFLKQLARDGKVVETPILDNNTWTDVPDAHRFL